MTLKEDLLGVAYNGVVAYLMLYYKVSPIRSPKELVQICREAIKLIEEMEKLAWGAMSVLNDLQPEFIAVLKSLFLGLVNLNLVLIYEP